MMIVRLTKKLESNLSDVDMVELTLKKQLVIFQFFTYCILVVTRFGLEFAIFSLAVPLNVIYTPQQGFSFTARRKPNGEYLGSYSRFLQTSQYSVAVVLFAILLIASQFILAIAISLSLIQR